MYTIKLTRKAGRNLNDIAEHYDNEQEGLGKDFIDEVNKKIAEIKEWPFAARAGLNPETREKIMLRYPYLIVYKVVNKQINVLTVYHQKRQHP